MNIDTLSTPSNRLKASDLDGSECMLTIKGYTIQEFEETSTKSGETYMARKPEISFEGTDKTFICNKTNREAIAYVYGKEMDDWIGKQITLYPTVVPFGDKNVEAIRVRVTKVGGAKPKFLQDGPSDEIPF